MHDDVRGFSKHRGRVAHHRHAPRRILRAHNFAKVAPGFCWIFVNRSDDLDGVFLTQQLYDGRADRPDSILNRAYLFLHAALPTALATLGANIKQSAEMFNSNAAFCGASLLAAMPAGPDNAFVEDLWRFRR